MKRDTRHSPATKRICLSILAIVGLLCAQAQAQIELSNDKPAVDEIITVTLAEPATELMVTYRPNSGVVAKIPITLAEASTTFTWTPDRAGIATLSAGSASKNVSIRFSSFPFLGLLIMLGAAGILFGGALFAFRVLFRDGQGSTASYDSDVMHHPDT